MIGSRPIVLVVEDDRDVREAVAEVLADHGYQPVAVANGREALESLRAGPRPNVILLDIMMPVMDGWEFRAAQKADPGIAEIPVIVLTAHAGAQRAAEEMDADGYLRKPVRLDDLLGELARHCQPR